MKVVLLAGKSVSTSIVYNFLSREKVKFDAVLIEDKLPTTLLLKRRLKKLGYSTVFGQILFHSIFVRTLHIISKKRINEILSDNCLDNSPIPEDKITHVSSVNDDSVVSKLLELSPDVVIVNGTRIISKKLLDAVPASFINMHVGITPAYRGVHGAYWALTNGDKSNAGVTIHYIDQGIDTGKVIAQDVIDVTDKDNFVTYPYLQTVKGLKLMLSTIKLIEKGEKPESESNLSLSKLWSHPTAFEYIYYYFSKGVK